MDHLAHLRSLVIAGDAVAVGPMADDGDIAGVAIFRDMPVANALELESTDRAVVSGLFVLDAHPWWGPKGIGDGYAARAKETPLEKLPFAQFQFGLLTKGATWTADETAELEKLQERHLAHINEMATSGKLVAAGPFTDNGTLRGLFIFKATAEEAKAMAAEDPMVRIDRLIFDLHPWMTTEGIIPQPH